MKLIFFDEVKNNPDYPHYHLGAVCIDDTALMAVEKKVQDLAQRVFLSSRLSVETEFHAIEIFQKKGNFKDEPDFGKRIAVLGELIGILSLKEVQRIYIQINCSKLTSSQPPDEFAFMFLCERASQLVGGQKSIGMLIGDRENDKLSAKYATCLSGYRAHGTDYAYGCDINHLVDSVHFTPSYLSRFLQLADIYVWMLQFMNRKRGSSKPKDQAVFDLLKREGVDLIPSRYKEWPKI